MTCDPQWTSVALLLDFDGTNGQTTFTDLSLYANPVTNVGDVVTVDTSIAQFGTGSGLWNGNSNAGLLTVPVTTGGPLDVGYGNADFTIEFWVYFNDFAIGGFPIDDPGVSAQKLKVNLQSNIFSLTTDEDSGTVYNAGIPTASIGGFFSPFTWYSLAFVLESNVLTAYLNGVAGTPVTISGNVLPTSGTLYIGQEYGGTGAASQHIDELRISNYARYSGDYTPTAVAFPVGGCATTVPNVVGLLDAAAQAAIVAAELTVGTITNEVSSDPLGTVLAQNPAAGSTVAPGDAVDLTEAVGAIVPDLTNTSVAVVAPGLLAAAGLVLGSVTRVPSGIVLSGNVISQSPAAGSAVAGGSSVNVVVSSGLPALTVPDLFGLDETDAINAITTLGLVVGAIGSAPSQFVPPGGVQTQNPSPGANAAPGDIVSFVLSTGEPATGTLFDFEATVISQYANSPTILQLVSNLNQYVDQSTNFANFFNYVWNVDTAQGFGLDIWGVIVGVSRLLHIPNTTDYVGFDNSATPPPDWQTMGSTQTAGGPVGGAMYTGYNANETYLLPDDAYRQLILAKAFANICATTAPAVNQILQNLYGPGTAYVLNTGVMAISYNLTFTPTAIQLAILEQSGVIPTPPGVAVTINTNV